MSSVSWSTGWDNLHSPDSERSNFVVVIYCICECSSQCVLANLRRDIAIVRRSLRRDTLLPNIMMGVCMGICNIFFFKLRHITRVIIMVMMMAITINISVTLIKIMIFIMMTLYPSFASPWRDGEKEWIFCVHKRWHGGKPYTERIDVPREEWGTSFYVSDWWEFHTNSISLKGQRVEWTPGNLQSLSLYLCILYYL